VDEKRRPVPPGTPSASVLLTNLANRVQPLIRYDLGDSVTLGAARCSCGSPFPTVRVEGRSDEILRLKAGRGRVSLLPMGIATVIEEEARVHRFQVVQTAPGALEVRLEPAPGAGDREERARVKRVVGGYLARHGLPDATLAVKRTPLEASARSGKFRHVWREG
jgi:phenylacetate-coenzyme A ligase PaaK-like adenylate-forming protein